MKVILFGATGMVGQGVLRECLLDPEIELVETIGRSATAGANPKLRNVVHQDLWNYGSIEKELTGFDACFFCLGVSSAGMSEMDYERVTYGITLAAAEMLARLNPKMTFIYVSGAGTDGTERGRTMWARVKGKTENALMRLPFASSYMFRPGFIQPMHGIQSKTKSYRVLYVMVKPLSPLLRWAFPNLVTNTEKLGKAMIAVAKRGASKQILEMKDIVAIAGS